MKLPLYTLLVCLAFTLAVDAQTTPPDLTNFEEIARDDKIIYFVNAKDAVRHNSRMLTIDVLGAHYKMDANGVNYALNNIAYIVTTYRIDCTAGTGQRVKDLGKWPRKDGTIETINKDFPTAVMEKPDKSRKLYLAIDVVCGGGKVPYKWTGGNGCNLIGGGKNEKVCCVAHDYGYRTGGNLRDKWQADSELFKCIWKRNKLLAPFVFVGTNVGGLAAFHWGKKRNLTPRAEAQNNWQTLQIAELAGG